MLKKRKLIGETLEVEQSKLLRKDTQELNFMLSNYIGLRNEETNEEQKELLGEYINLITTTLTYKHISKLNQ